MFDHVTIRASDRAASERFYATVLAVLGIEPTYAGDALVEWDDFSVAPAEDASAVTRGLHVAFVARTRALVDEFWRARDAARRESVSPTWPRRSASTRRSRCTRGLRLSTDTLERAQFRGASRSFSVLSGSHVTENLHMAFGADDDGTVDAFHRSATAAG